MILFAEILLRALGFLYHRKAGGINIKAVKFIIRTNDHHLVKEHVEISNQKLVKRFGQNCAGVQF